MTKHTTISIVSLAAVLILLPIAAFASDKEDIENLKNAKISLVQAIEIAEKDRGGQAFEAGIEDDSFQPAYEIEVFKDDVVWEVYVNSQTGQVISAREDKDN